MLLDHIAIPDFAAGAMENWGLITYLMRSLLYNPQESSVSDKQWVALVVSHELAHQVTMNFVASCFCVNQNFIVMSSCCFVSDLFPFLLLNFNIFVFLCNHFFFVFSNSSFDSKGIYEVCLVFLHVLTPLLLWYPSKVPVLLVISIRPLQTTSQCVLFTIDAYCTC